MNVTEPRWKTVMTKVLNLLGVAASLVLITSISFEALTNATFSGETIYTRIQLGVCLYFLLDFLLLLVTARDRWRFFSRNFILILLSVPYAWLVDYFAFDFSSETLYVIHFLPIVRGGIALAVLVKMVVSNRISGLFIVYLALFFAISYFQTLIFYVFEARVNPLVKSYPDALWWASMTVTTVGSNIIPVTTIGKICTAVLAVVGMTTFPIFTAYITALVHNFNEREKKRVRP
ncbi:potassium channel family protein [Pusillimonas sp. T2]|uniref:potassium channel family protein n=1 Tax=Pusillimonas sp. T2 TaxID=1548123 RepID=UPI0020B17795|nr:potassium channel family protein [Pusillimonas sp. T2]